MSDNMSTPSGSMDDTFVIGGEDITLDISNYADSQTTCTIGNLDTITLGGTSVSTGSLNWSAADYGIYSINNSPGVNITSEGIDMKSETDIKIGDRSLKDFMDRVEDRLAILRPNEALEDKWEDLKNLRRQYEALEKDILEKEKIMKILKEQ